MRDTKAHAELLEMLSRPCEEATQGVDSLVSPHLTELGASVGRPDNSARSSELELMLVEARDEL